MEYYVHSTADVSPESQIGDGTKVWHQAQVREKAKIGKNCIIGKGSYIDFGVTIGDNVKIQNGVFVYHGVTVESGVFLGPGVILTNDKNPRATDENGNLKNDDDWVLGKILIKKGASIGAGSVILPGVTIGEYALIGAGSVVTKNVPDYSLVYGNPAKVYGKVDKLGNVIGRS